MSCNNSSVKVFIPIIVYILGLYDDVSMGLEDWEILSPFFTAVAGNLTQPKSATLTVISGYRTFCLEEMRRVDTS